MKTFLKYFSNLAEKGGKFLFVKEKPKNVPSYAYDTETGEVNWAALEKDKERREFYHSLYNKESVKAAATKARAEILKDQATAVNYKGGAEVEIKRGMTLGKIIKEVAGGDGSLMREGLWNLQDRGLQVDRIIVGDKLIIKNNRLTILDSEGNVRKDKDTGEEIKDFKIFNLEMAEEVETTAEEVETTAEEVETTAEDVETTAEEVETTAEEVETTAEDVETTAEDVETTAEDVETTAEDVETTAEDVETTAEDVETTAEDVETTAEDVETTAEDVETTAEDVETTAEELTIESIKVGQEISYEQALALGIADNANNLVEEGVTWGWVAPTGGDGHPNNSAPINEWNVIRLAEDVETTAEDVETTAEDVETTAEDVETTAEDVETTAEDVETTAEEVETTAEDVETTAEEVETTAEDVETTAEDVETTAEEVETTAEDVETTAEDVETTAEDVETTAEDVETTAEDVETTAEDVETTAEDVETTAEDVETTAEDVETTAEDVETTAEEAEHLTFTEKFTATAVIDAMKANVQMSGNNYQILAKDGEPGTYVYSADDGKSVEFHFASIDEAAPDKATVILHGVSDDPQAITVLEAMRLADLEQ